MDWTRNILGLVVDVQRLVDGRWNRLDLSPQFLFDLVEIKSIIPGDEIDSQTKMSKSTRATNAMQICFRILGEVEVDDNVDGLNIDTTSEKIRANQISRNTCTEVMEDFVAVVLHHTGVGIEA